MSGEIEALFARLGRSRFRARFRLGERERAYAKARGRAVIAEHAADFVARRLAPAAPPNDGRQTPMRGHPVFIAQHATATCCRSCLRKWHGLAEGRELTPEEQARLCEIVMAWIIREMHGRR